MHSRAVLALGFCAALAACSGKGTKDTERRPKAPPEPPAIAAIVAPNVVYSSAATDIDKGKELFNQKGCSACHKIGGGKLVGPDLKGVTARRDTVWLSRMILRPDVMVKEDATAKELLKTHMTPMPNQGVNPDNELAPILSYLKSNES